MPTILVVDDTESSRSALARLLRREGYETETAIDGVDALRRLDELGAQRPDLLLLDVRMPEIDGLDVLERLHENEHLRGMPVIMLTSECDYHCVRRAEQLGAKDHCVKTAFSLAEMLQHISSYTRPVCN